MNGKLISIAVPPLFILIFFLMLTTTTFGEEMNAEETSAYKYEAGNIWIQRKEYDIKSVKVEEDTIIITLIKPFTSEEKKALESMTTARIEYILEERKEEDPSVEWNLCTLVPGEKKIVVNDFFFSLSDSPYISENKVLMIPIRAVFEKFNQIGDVGYQIEWVDKEKLIKCNVGSRVSEVSIIRNTMMINGYGPFALSNKIEMKNDTAYISVEDFKSILGMAYSWYDFNEQKNEYYIPVL